MPRFRSSALTLALCVAAPAWFATGCREHFAGGAAPVVTNARLKSRTREVCFAVFAVLHSDVSHTPLYSAEHLTRLIIDAIGRAAP